MDVPLGGMTRWCNWRIVNFQDPFGKKFTSMIWGIFTQRNKINIHFILMVQRKIYSEYFIYMKKLKKKYSFHCHHDKLINSVNKGYPVLIVDSHCLKLWSLTHKENIFSSFYFVQKSFFCFRHRVIPEDYYYRQPISMIACYVRRHKKVERY